ncbi:MAG TPA: NUDIX hydrolase [Gaiellales bacterium]
MSRDLTLAAAVVLRDADGRVLLVKENYGRRRWGLPGGEMALGESPGAAAIRETAEETGLEVELAQLVAVYFLRTERPGLRFIFEGTIVRGAPTLQPGGEIAEIEWFSPSALPAAMTHTAPHGIRHAVAGSRGAFLEIGA